MKIFSFLNEVKIELAKVTWPKRGEVIKLTAVVLIISGVVGLYIGAVDYGLTRVLEIVLAR